ncbi:helix-turn-helix domain-containing protein [Carnobacterium mobile]|uniref:helix-turn-helix domain-containing protein n=1 Tax=Carnobacterium mobile TaxID=2750 RepID=UPI000555372C|nr:Rgg/GadR/MutR family transcriptional regulator [Carnobacterium mobile]
MNIGGTIQRIRTGKNISQAVLSENIISRPHLSLIENDKYDLSFNTLLKLLQKMHISMEEFLYLTENYTVSEVRKLSVQLMSAANKGSIDELEEIQKKAKSKLNSQEDFEYFHLYLLTKTYIYLWNNNFKLDEEVEKIVQPIKGYLLNLSEWYIYDLKLLNNILFVFDLSSIHSISKKVLKSLEKYKDYPSARNDYLFLLINMSTYYIEKGLYQESLEFSCLGKEKVNNNIYEKIVLDINDSVANIKLGKESKKNKERLTNRLFILDSLDFKELKNHFQELLEQHDIWL